jgi:hypothetical protein
MRVRNFFMLLSASLVCGASFGQTSWVPGSGGNIANMYMNAATSNLLIGATTTGSAGGYKLGCIGFARFATNQAGSSSAGYVAIMPADNLSGFNTSLELVTGGNSSLTSQIDFKGGFNWNQDFKGRMSYTDGTGFNFYTNASTTSQFRIKEDGKTVIGDPAAITSTSNDYKLFVQTGINTPKMLIGDPALIPTTTPSSLSNYKLFVQGGIITEKVKVSVYTSTDWADYVFAPDYQLLSLDSVETYINENQHLPGVPSSEEMVQNGSDLANTDKMLLEKVENLYLYIIQLNKEIEALKIQNQQLIIQQDETK